jgi:predicted neuraminidase
MNTGTLGSTVALALTLAAPSLAGTPVVDAQFIFPPERFPQSHASTIVETEEGLVAAWFAGSREGVPDVGIWLSRNRDGTWTDPIEVATGTEDGETRYSCRNPVLFQPRQGPLLLFYKVGPDPTTWWGRVMSSTDAGRTWSPSRRLPEGILGPVKNKPVQLANGDILSGSSTEHDGWRVHLERSSDQGETWVRTPPLVDPRAKGAIQPSVLVHRDGRLQLLCRDEEQAAGRIRSSWSEDGGRSWTVLTATELPNPSAGTDAVTLSDGRHMLVYNHGLSAGPAGSGRGILNVAVSEDGEAWQAALVLEEQAGERFSYPAVIQTSDALVHITYTWKRKSIKHVVLDPSRLDLRRIVGGQWP